MEVDCVNSSTDGAPAANWPMLCQQIKYYFSDYFLNQSKAARRLFEAKQGYTVDELLQFKRFRSIVDKKHLLVCLQANPCFNSIEYSSDGQLLRRATPFVANKKYKLDNAHKILYLSGLPNETTMENLEKVLASFKYTAIETKKSHKEKNIHSCLIEFDDSANANKFYKFVLSNAFQLGIDGSERVKVSKYRSYHANLQKHRRSTKRARQIQLALGNLSLNSSGEASNSSMVVDNVVDDDDDGASKKSVPIQFGFHRLLRRRTIVFTNRDSIDFETIRSVLTTLGVIYTYHVQSSPSKYYLLFQNRQILDKFYADLDGELLNDVVLIEHDQLKNVRLQLADFSFIDENETQVEGMEFEAFVRCAKRFFRGKK